VGLRRLGVITGCLVVCAAAAAAVAAVRADWGVTISKPAVPVRATKPFTVLIETAPADENKESYNSTLTLTPSAALRIVSWKAGNGLSLPCTRTGRVVQCTQRSIGDLASTLIAVVTLRASKAGRHSLAVKLAIAGDTNAANDTATRIFTARTAPRRR
jgi:hypothetical protein